MYFDFRDLAYRFQMQTAKFKSYFRNLTPAMITGPIFDKELRVSSRRLRNFLLRAVYLLLLTFFVSLVWYSQVPRARGGTLSYSISRMSQAGLVITTTIIWFQFIATQVLAVIMLSNAISDEVYHKTLGVLMTTPINTFQIVMGKLLSRLLQLILLIALSLPLLGVVRIFGGIPWNFIVSSLSINLTAILFAGSLSLFFSVSGKRTYEVILKTVFTLGMLYLILPLISTLAMRGLIKYVNIPDQHIISFLYYTNPLATLQFNTMELLNPGYLGFNTPKLWYLHCGLMAGVSVLLLTRSIVIVRRVALLQALGQSLDDAKNQAREEKKLKSGKKKKITRQDGVIRPVIGSPVIWKEMRGPMIEGGKKQGTAGVLISFAALLFTYYQSIREGTLDEDHVHTSYGVTFMLLGVIMTMVLSATSITMEKESRSWPLLMATPLSEWQILLGKAVGVIKRSSPIWLFLAGHLLFFILIGYINPIAIFHLGMLAAAVIIFLCGTGIFFSSTFRRTTSAVVANISLVALIWLIAPIFSSLIAGILNNRAIADAAVSVNPVIQSGVVMFGDSGTQNVGVSLSQLEYKWPSKKADDFGTITLLVFLTSLGYSIAGIFFAWQAKRRFRKNIF